MKRTVLTALAAGLLFAPATWAADDDDEGPGRGVARLSLINGDVSVRRGDSGDWVAAAVNAPLVVDDHVLTGAGSRAELQFDWANMLRLAANTDVRLAALEHRRYQVQVARGMVTMSVLRDSDAEVEVDTPTVSVRPVKRGRYRVTVLENGESEVTVRFGEVEVYTPRGVEKLRSGRTMLVRGTTTDPEYQVVEAASRDNWDEWNEDRDRRLERSRSYEYVSRDIYGVDDLDHHGRWVHVPPYGMVWSPYGVGAGWAPYRHGRWAWVDWYGWTWVSYDPWGWAPYHYGRWFHHGPYGWCWYPGPRYSRHYWRPALVAFFGLGVGPVHIGVGFGRIGWVPLAPYEPYHRWYGRNIYRGYRGGGYVDNRVRIVNNVNITNIYRNARVVNGVSGVDHGDFTRGRPGRAFSRDELRVGRASLVQGALPVTPGRESLRLSDREVRGGLVTRATPDRFYSRRQPTAVDRVPFDQQRRGVEQMARRTFGERSAGGAATPAAGGWRGGEAAGGRAFTDAQRQAAEARPGTPQVENRSGWRRLGESRPAAEQGPAVRNRESLVTRPEQSGDNAGWRRFGDRGGAAERSQEPVRARPDTNRRESGGDTGQGSTWRRFEGGANRSDEPARARPDTGRSEGASPRFERRSESPRWSGGSEREAVRVNPPIVRERSTPRMDRGDSGGSGGGAVRSAPRMERGGSGGGGGGGAVRSAPRSSGGGDGGGGGGGGGRVRGGGGRGR